MTERRLETVAVIPARLGSTRFPGKILADRTGKPLIQHVYEQAARAESLDDIVVAADDRQIVDAVHAFGGRAVLTRDDHPNGTSRIAEVVPLLPESVGIVVNVQGDEPEIDPTLIDVTVHALVDSGCPMATLASPFADDEDPADPNLVKVVADLGGRAMHFTRSPLAGGLRHVGLYVYRRDFVLTYAGLDPTPLEQLERLEQLRVIENGYELAVAVAVARHHGIDTPEQYEAFVERQRANSPA